MKAKEYYEKYEFSLHSNDDATINKGLSDMMLEMARESEKMIQGRHAKSNSALVGVLNEQNNKWNAVITLDEKKYGGSMIARNGFKAFWLHKMPELRMLWK